MNATRLARKENGGHYVPRALPQPAFVLIMTVFVLGAGCSKPQQRRTIADVRTIATSVESYATEYKRYPSSLKDVQEKLFGSSFQLPKTDGWGQPYAYACWNTVSNAEGWNAFAVASAGSDGKFEHSELKAYTKIGPTQKAAQDIVFMCTALPPRTAAAGSIDCGEFLQYPAGMDKNAANR